MIKLACNQVQRAGEVSRLLTAAVVNQEFCALLLSDPEVALEKGFNGECFRFCPEDKAVLLAMQASSLQELAQQLVLWLDQEIL
jgi:hypothetical protein